MSGVQVYAGASSPSHELSLSDGEQTWGLRLDGGAAAIRETALGGELRPAQIEQRDWSGGRGAPRFSAQRYYDSQNAWTLTPGQVHAAPQWRYASGLRGAAQHLPGDVSWQALTGAQRGLAAAFSVGAAGLDARRARVWLRRVGSPGALSLQLHEDSVGAPGATLPGANGALTAADVPDVVSRLHSFELSGFSATLDPGAYHLSLLAAAGDNAADHWEVGVEPGAAGGHASADGAAWSLAGACAYYRVEDGGLSRSFHLFQLVGALYAVDQRADGSASHAYLNGDRGRATGGGAETISDANKNWPADKWSGAWVRITRAKGMGQARRIAGNSATQLSVEPPWDEAPAAGSDYIIYATDLWQDVSPTTGDLIDAPVLDVTATNFYALLARGDSLPILRMRFNSGASVPKHEFADEGSGAAAEFVHSFHHAELGAQVWRSIGSQISRSATGTWSQPFSFDAGISLGVSSLSVSRLLDWNDELWAFKPDGIWTLGHDDRPARLNVGIEGFMYREAPPALAWGGRLHFGWGAGLLATTGRELADIGPGRGEGLPPGRGGRIAALAPLGAGRLAAAVDAGAGESSVLAWDGAGWHELLRAPQAGLRAQSLAWQDCPGTQPRLWAAIGGDLMWLPLPAGDNPLGEPGMAFQHEGVLVGSTVDMDAPLLPKLLGRVSLLSSGLGEDAEVELDYQVDGEIGGAAWRQAGGFHSSPLESLALEAGELRAIRPRLRLLSKRAGQPAVVQGTLLEGLVRTPLRYQWELRVRLGELLLDGRGGLEAAPDAFVAWLRQAAQSAARFHLRSIWPALDDKYVIVEPPVWQRQTRGGDGVLVLRVREG